MCLCCKNLVSASVTKESVKACSIPIDALPEYSENYGNHCIHVDGKSLAFLNGKSLKAVAMDEQTFADSLLKFVALMIKHLGEMSMVITCLLFVYSILFVVNIVHC